MSHLFEFIELLRFDRVFYDGDVGLGDVVSRVGQFVCKIHGSAGIAVMRDARWMLPHLTAHVNAGLGGRTKARRVRFAPGGFGNRLDRPPVRLHHALR